MELDSVELIMSVERHFDIEIPDRVVETLLTVGSLHNFLVEELGQLGRIGIESEVVFSELLELICNQLGVKAEEVVPSARFVQDRHID